MNAEIEQLRRLLRLGFRAQQILDDAGQCQALYLSREYAQPIREVVLAYPDGEVLAFRATGAFDITRPFFVPEGTLLWAGRGDLVTTTHSLLTQPLPQPGTPAWTTPDHQ